MAIGKLLHWLYCLDFAHAVVLLFACSALFCIAENRFARSSLWKLFVTLLLLAVATGVIYTTLVTHTSGEILQINLMPLHSYREVMNGGNPEILQSNFMNAVLFYPIGLLATALLPVKWSERFRWVLTIILGMMLSIGIEYLQYAFSLGQCEIDDVIHNVLGALVGSIMILRMPSWVESISDKVKYLKIRIPI